MISYITAAVWGCIALASVYLAVRVVLGERHRKRIKRGRAKPIVIGALCLLAFALALAVSALRPRSVTTLVNGPEDIERHLAAIRRL